MPPPVSYIDITSIPFTRLVTQAEFNVANEIWFRFVTTDPVTYFGMYTDKGGTFRPQTRVYESDGSTLIKSITDSYGFYVKLPTASTYYIKINKYLGGASDFDFTSQFETAPINATIPPGAFIVNDDAAGWPGTAWELDGTFLGVYPEIPSGETGDSLPDGLSLLHDRFGQHSGKLALISNQGRLVLGGFDTTPSLGLVYPLIANDETKFYVSDGAYIWTVSRTGTVSGIISTLTGGIAKSLGISKDSTIAYWAKGVVAPFAIHRHDLINDIAISDLYVIPGTDLDVARTGLNHQPGEILVLPDNSIVTYYHNTVTDVSTLLHLSAAGAVLHSYSYAPEVYLDHIHYSPATPDTIYIWFFNDTGSIGTYGELNLSTGTISPSFIVAHSSEGVNLERSNPTYKTNIWTPSNSCIMLTTQYGEPVEPPPGTIIVTKVATESPDTVFDFTAGGGLSPTSFSLKNGESQIFTAITPGSGYTVAETVKEGWNTNYSVSNGSLISNLTVASGETVYVTVTNSLPSISAGGIYKIVPGKREDTLWLNISPRLTVDVKIPDPFIRTGLVGE